MPNELTVLLEYIDLFQSEWQHVTTIWEGLLCPLLFFYIVFKFNLIKKYFAQICSYYASIMLFVLPSYYSIIPIILPAKLTHPYIQQSYTAT